MSNPRQVLFNTLEQVLSPDANRIGSLAGKAAQDPLIGLTAGVSGTPRSVVRRGLDANPGAGLSVDVDDGELMLYDAGAGADESKYKLGKLAATYNVVVAANASGSPRIDVIHGTPAVLDSDLTPRNILTLPSRVVVPTNVNKTRDADLTVAITAGIPGPTPAFPTAPAGSVPLWYVYVPNGAATITNDHLMDARVYWRPFSLAATLNQLVRGLQPGIGSTSTRAQFTPGFAFVTGALAESASLVDELMSDLIQLGEPALAADTQYDFYVVTKGNGVPVGKTVPDGLVFVATGQGVANPPLANGQPPGGGLTYGPLHFAAASAIATSVVNLATTSALYLGSLITGVGASFSAGTSPVLDRQGDVFAHAIQASDGRFPSPQGWLREGLFRYLSTTQVILSNASGCVIDGSPRTQGNTAVIFDITANLASGEAEAPSTWYYCYLRKRVSERAGGAPGPFRAPERNVVPIISAEAPSFDGGKPTPEVIGAQTWLSEEYLFVGTVYNDAAGDFVAFRRAGDTYLFLDLYNLPSSPFTPPTAPAKTIITECLVPSTSRAALVSISYRGTSVGAGAAGSVLRVYAETGRANPHLEVGLFVVAGGAGELWWGNTADTIVAVDSSGQFEIQEAPGSVNIGTLGAYIQQRGYVEDPNSHS